MSRNIIQNHKPNESISIEDASKGKVLITEYQGSLCSFFLKNNRLLSANRLLDSSKIGAIYIAKVKNVLKNIDACFVEIDNKEICFLPFKEAQMPFCRNRAYDGRLLQGDELLVQVTKDALKTKQASVSCNISLQSSFFVFEVGSTKVGISGKLSVHEKKQIRQLLTDAGITDSSGQLIQPKATVPYAMVVRTEAARLLEQSPENFLEELRKQQQSFLQLFETARYRSCFSCIQPRITPYKAILDHYSVNEYAEVVTDLNEAYTSLQADIAKPLRLYEDVTYPLSKLYSLETRLKEALQKNVWLKSGANLVIEQTECLTTIDVNSGKKIKGDVSQETIWQINEEAAKEAALQIRLRNLSGIIIIDFINMEEKELEDKLILLMKELLAGDRITVTVVDITPLGLMEITRKKVNKSLKEQFEGIHL